MRFVALLLIFYFYCSAPSVNRETGNSVKQENKNDGPYYFIINPKSGYSMEVGWASTSAGTEIFHQILYGGENQLWKLSEQGNGEIALINKNSGLAFSLNAENTRATQEVFQGKAGQKFRLKSGKNGTVFFQYGSNQYLKPFQASQEISSIHAGEGEATEWILQAAWNQDDFDEEEAFVKKVTELPIPEKTKKAYWIQINLKQNRFSKVISDTEDRARFSQDYNSIFYTARFDAMLGLAHVAFAESKFSKAVELYENLLKEISDSKINWGKNSSGWNIQTYLNLAKERLKLGNIDPGFKYKVLVIFVENTDIGGKKRKLQKSQKERMFTSVGLVSRFLEVATKGAITIISETKYLNATLNTLARDGYSPVYHLISSPGMESFELEKMFVSNLDNFDHVAFFWNGTGIVLHATGGVGMFSYLGDQIYSPRRGVTQISSFFYSTNDYLPVSLHEFFHTSEGLGGIGPEHGYTPENRSHFPAWKGKTEYDYMRWHFDTTIKNKGWETFSLKQEKHTVDKEYLKLMFSHFSKYSHETKKLSYDYLIKADILFDKGDKAGAGELYEKSRDLFPFYARAHERAKVIAPVHYWLSSTNLKDKGLFQSDLVGKSSTSGKNNHPKYNETLIFKDSNSELSNATYLKAPSQFALSLDFKVSEGNGGWILGFGGTQFGESPSHDRLLSINKNGKLDFYMWFLEEMHVTSSERFDDNRWHNVLATFESGKMSLYADGKKLAEKDTKKNALDFYGYWKLAAPTKVNWLKETFQGSIADVKIYYKAP